MLCSTKMMVGVGCYFSLSVLICTRAGGIYMARAPSNSPFSLSNPGHGHQLEEKRYKRQVDRDGTAVNAKKTNWSVAGSQTIVYRRAVVVAFQRAAKQQVVTTFLYTFFLFFVFFPTGRSEINIFFDRNSIRQSYIRYVMRHTIHASLCASKYAGVL